MQSLVKGDPLLQSQPPELVSTSHNQGGKPMSALPVVKVVQVPSKQSGIIGAQAGHLTQSLLTRSVSSHTVMNSARLRYFVFVYLMRTDITSHYHSLSLTRSLSLCHSFSQKKYIIQSQLFGSYVITAATHEQALFVPLRTWVSRGMLMIMILMIS